MAVRRALAVERPEWQLLDARRYYLGRLTKLFPEVLRELEKIRSKRERDFCSEKAALDGWAAKYALARPWALVAARNTLALWDGWPKGRGRAWDPNLDDSGARVSERGRLPRRPEEKRIRPEHFDWLARRAVSHLPYEEAGPRTRTTVSRAVRSLAAFLDVSIPHRSRVK